MQNSTVLNFFFFMHKVYHLPMHSQRGIQLVSAEKTDHQTARTKEGNMK
jgi:hypothetical protein